MAADPSGAVSTEPTGSVTAPASGAVSTEDGNGKQASDTIRELRKRAQEAEDRAKAFELKERQREETEALARGEHEQVIAQLKKQLEELTPEVESYRAATTARREALLSALSDEDKPLADGLPLDRLEKLVERLGKKEPPPPGNPPARPGAAPVATSLTPEEVRRGVRTGGLAWFRENAGKM